MFERVLKALSSQQECAALKTAWDAKAWNDVANALLEDAALQVSVRQCANSIVLSYAEEEDLDKVHKYFETDEYDSEEAPLEKVPPEAADSSKKKPDATESLFGDNTALADWCAEHSLAVDVGLVLMKNQITDPNLLCLLQKQEASRLVQELPLGCQLAFRKVHEQMLRAHAREDSSLVVDPVRQGVESEIMQAKKEPASAIPGSSMSDSDTTDNEEPMVASQVPEWSSSLPEDVGARFAKDQIFPVALLCKLPRGDHKTFVEILEWGRDGENRCSGLCTIDKDGTVFDILYKRDDDTEATFSRVKALVGRRVLITHCYVNEYESRSGVAVQELVLTKASTFEIFDDAGSALAVIGKKYLCAAKRIPLVSSGRVNFEGEVIFRGQEPGKPNVPLEFTIKDAEGFSIECVGFGSVIGSKYLQKGKQVRILKAVVNPKFRNVTVSGGAVICKTTFPKFVGLGCKVDWPSEKRDSSSRSTSTSSPKKARKA